MLYHIEEQCSLPAPLHMENADSSPTKPRCSKQLNKEKVVGCKCSSTLISFLPSLFPSLCSTSHTSYSAASSSAKSHSPDLSDMLRRGLSHVFSHMCRLRLLREATPLSLIHTGLHKPWCPVLEAPWDSTSATMAIQFLWIGLFSCLSIHRGR